jgi:hypothetical protein
MVSRSAAAADGTRSTTNRRMKENAERLATEPRFY